MTPEGIGVGIAALGAIAGIVKWIVGAEMAAHTLQIQQWINGSFMRSKEVEAKMATLETRVDGIECAADNCPMRNR